METLARMDEEIQHARRVAARLTNLGDVAIMDRRIANLQRKRRYIAQIHGIEG